MNSKLRSHSNDLIYTLTKLHIRVLKCDEEELNLYFISITLCFVNSCSTGSFGLQSSGISQVKVIGNR